MKLLFHYKKVLKSDLSILVALADYKRQNAFTDLPLVCFPFFVFAIFL